MNPLLKRLRSLRRKVRMQDGWLGVCALLSLIVGVAVCVGVVDYSIHLPSLVRGIALVGLLVGSGIVVNRYFVRPFTKPCDDLNLALRIEDAYPELNDSLASTVQFLKQSSEDSARLGGSASMRDRTIEDTLQKANSCDFSRILDRRAVLLFGVAALCILSAAGTVAAKYWDYTGIALMRFVEPFGQHTWTTLEVQRLAPIALNGLSDGNQWEPIELGKPDRVAKDQPYKVKVNLTGQIPSHVKIEIVGQIRHEQTFPLEGKSSLIIPIPMTQQYQTFRFRITANDGAFPARSGAWHNVEVLPPPSLIDLDGQPSPQITVYPPAYTDLPSPQRLLSGTRNIEVIAGTQVTLRARANRPLHEAWLEFRPDNDHLLPLARLMMMGEIHPLMALGQAASGYSAWGSIPAQFEDADQETFRIRFTPWLSGGYVLHLLDKDRLPYSEAAQLIVQRDPIPDVKLTSPAATITSVPNADVSFKYLVTDEMFAIKSVYAEYRLKTPDGRYVEDEPVRRNSLYEADHFGMMIPYWFAKMSHNGHNFAKGFESPIRGSEQRLRYQKLDVDMVWSLRNEFKAGTVVEVQICAEDFCDVYLPREAGRSRAVDIRIVSVYEMKRKADEAVAQILKHTQQAENVQKRAMDGVKEARKLDKTDQKSVDQFVEKAEQPQREVQDIIGRTPDEGLRRDLKELRQMLKDNKLTDTQAFRDAGTIKGALDNIAKGELPQIDPKMAEIRNELAKNGKVDPKTQKKLDDTAKLQDRVLQSLAELNRKLDPDLKMSEIKAAIGDITEKERNLLQDLEDLKAKKAELDKQDPSLKGEREKDYQNKVEQKAKEQVELANQLQKLIKEMKSELEHQEKLGNKENAEKLKDAIEKLERPKVEPMPVDAQMKRVADDLKGKSEAPHQTIQKQKDIVKNLDKALEALEGKNESTTRKDIQNRKDAQKDLDKLAKKLQQLQDESKKIEMMEDPQEKLKAKEELANKHRELQQELDKTRRELARLQEQKAANDVDEAIQKIENAANKLENGGDPQADQKRAQDDIKQAKQELKEAEEELAREELIKIADHLKALKERQDATLERSEKLHDKIVKLKSWRDSFLTTNEGNIENQTGIGEETDTLSEKLKEAKVFNGILKRAKKGMDEAVSEMKSRHAIGKELQYVEMGGDERMDVKELTEEKETHETVMRHQKQASKSLGNLLDSLKEELAKKPKKDNNQQAKKPDEPPPEDKGGMRAQDGIPPKAQLKALRSEQLDLMEQTKAFDERHPDRKNLTKAQREELRLLYDEQERLQALFGELVAPPAVPKEGEMP